MFSARFFVFCGAAVLLAIAPGPGMLYVLARSLAGGKREGVLSAFGTFLGGLVHVMAAATGLSLVLAQSALAFAAVKYMGAAYLCFLGVRMLLDAHLQADRDTELPVVSMASTQNAFWQGIATEVLNPKTALFFLSFIPQFVIRQSGHVLLQFLMLGTISVTLNTCADLIVITMAGPIRKRIHSAATFRRRQRSVTGVIMIGLGAWLATSETK